MNLGKAAFLAALLVASPAHGDLHSGSKAEVSGGEGMDALDGQSNEGAGVIAPHGGRENIDHRQWGSEGTNNNDEVNWLRSGHAKESGFDLGLDTVVGKGDDKNIYSTKTEHPLSTVRMLRAATSIPSRRKLDLFSSSNQVLFFNESSYVNPANNKYAQVYDLHEMDLPDGFSEEVSIYGQNQKNDHIKEDVAKGRSKATPLHSEINEAYSIRGKNPNQGKNPVPPKKAKDPSYVHSTTMHEVMEKLNNHHSRELVSLSPSEVATAGDAILAAENGNLELGLDILAATVVSSICYAVSWGLAANTAGVSVAAAPLFCAAAAFWSGLIFSGFSWIGDTEADDAHWTVEAADVNYADGNSLNIAYIRNHGTDRDSLGWIDRGEIKTTRDDLDKQHLQAIEIFIDDTNDVCVKNMQFQVNRQPSGTGERERISITAPVFAYITDSKIRSQGAHNEKEMCLYFGDAEHAIGNFKFHWRSALTCHKNFGAYFTLDYAKCLTHAMYRYDVRRNGGYTRYTYGGDQLLPSYYSNPFGMVKSKTNTGLCFDVANYNMDNYNPVGLINCKNNSAQKFDFDNDGRIRSVIDPTKCVEAGSAGTLYRKLYIYDCHGGDWQRWIRYTSGRIKNAHFNKYIGLAYCAVKHNNPLELRWYESGSCGEAQKWSW